MNTAPPFPAPAPAPRLPPPAAGPGGAPQPAVAPRRTAAGMLADVLAARPRGEAALALARGLVGAVAELHAQGRVHGALHPGTIRVEADGRVALGARGAGRPALGPGAPAGRAAFAAPEVLRGARPGRRADVFSTAALVQAILCGASPFEAPTAIEAAHRVLYRPPAPPGPEVPAALEDALAAALAKPRGRRAASVEGLRAALAPLAASARPLAAPAGAAAARAAPALWAAALRRLGDARRLAPALRARLPASRRGRAALAAAVLAAAGLVAVPRGEADLAAGVAARLSAGDAAGARALLEGAERAGRRGPLVDKLRGDVACARRASGECLRRYRLALAADPALRTDPVLRENARRLLGAEACGTRRAAAELIGELRDPGALPALREARRRGGLLAYFCTGDAIDRAIREVRAGER